ncbi:dimethylsulfonioproprionate lyase family protein [Ruegeria arenilitoris]|uniref:dimethylsulfonioproprionate lyase family protein n=1 Tax=Ruegeria arenilitoris TaxID=1173585 RepID=UPI00147CC867|nr:dimethylsulfonioproprionate lyase family protein [Ruegeria arenilitoris]
MYQDNPFHEMLLAISQVYLTEDNPMGSFTAQRLLDAPAAITHDPVLPCLMDESIRTVLSESRHFAAAAVLGAQTLIPWGSNPVEGNTEVGVAAMISVATLLGPDGPIPAPDVRLGLVYMRPNSYYPLHRHDADETYVVIAGRAIWTAGDDIRVRGEGDMIHHPSLMPHAFRTGPEGFVALWRWSGDINTHSYAFMESPETDLKT